VKPTEEILDFLAFSERLKAELRHSWLSDGRRESVADHTFQMALMAMLLHPRLAQPVDLERTLKMILVHDLVEADVGDVPFFETGERKTLKAHREREAAERIRDRLGSQVGREIYDLWHEFEARQTPEAKFAGALDHLEVQIQHNMADLSTWEPIEYDLVYTKMDAHCSFDPFLRDLCEAVKARAERKMRAGGVDCDSVKERLGVTGARAEGAPG
jgi:putative hydrolases of HD superfamily